MNQSFYKPNLYYNSISSNFDQSQPPQFPVIHQPPQETSVEILHDQENAINFMQTFLRKFNRYSFFETPNVLLLAWDRVFKIKDAFGNKQCKPEDIQELFRKLFNDVQNIHEELAEYINIPSWNRPAFYKNDEDDDENYIVAITPDFLITDSLIMEDEHLDTILEMESDKLIKSSVENLVPSPSESEDLSDIERECDVPVCDNFTTFSNSLFDADNDFSSSSSIISYPKFDSLLEEFSGKLAYIDLIPPRINEVEFDLEEEIRLDERLLYDNSSPQPLEDPNSKNFDVVIESFSPSPISVEGSDSLMEEIDLFLTSDNSMPLGIENDDYDSEGDILFLEELLSNDFPSLLENESFHFDVPSSPHPLRNYRMMMKLSSIREF
nr:hypothetical protein [Tanacetum cinerariifolium]